MFYFFVDMVVRIGIYFFELVYNFGLYFYFFQDLIFGLYFKIFEIGRGLKKCKFG